MATSLLYLKEFRCVKETDEEGNDSPYFIVFVGNRNHPKSMSIERKRLEAWDTKAYSGKLFTPNLYISNDVVTNSVVLVGLIEEDWDPDIGGTALLHAMLLPHWNNYTSAAWSNLSISQLAALMRDKMATVLKACMANDEYIQTRHLPISVEVGDLPLLNFYGDEGHYRVRFEMKSTQA